MSPIRLVLKAAAVGALALALSGCISLFPKTDPAGLYRFGQGAESATKGPPGTLVNVRRSPTAFTRASAGDRILTVTGGEAAYIAGARWVAPASLMFDEFVARAFDANAGRARLIGRGEAGQADLVLRLEVRSFETVYKTHGAAPEVLMQVRGVLNRNADRALIGDQLFEARVPAASNNISAIVAAYDEANAKTLGEIVSWVNSAGVDAPKT